MQLRVLSGARKESRAGNVGIGKDSGERVRSLETEDCGNVSRR